MSTDIRITVLEEHVARLQAECRQQMNELDRACSAVTVVNAKLQQRLEDIEEMLIRRVVL